MVKVTDDDLRYKQCRKYKKYQKGFVIVPISKLSVKNYKFQ